MLRSRVEALLREKKLDRTLIQGGMPSHIPHADREARQLTSGWTSVDRVLGGGFPRGECSEIVGSSSSGRTALVTTLLAEATRRGEIVALVDALDRFDPRAAVALSLDLTRVLWVRGTPMSPQALSQPPRRRGRGARSQGSQGVRGKHLRWEETDEDAAELLDRVVDRALKSFGLIAQAGGFGVVALDFADVPMPALRRLPFTTWFRLQRLIEGRDTVGIVLAPEPVARSARGVTVRLGADATRVIWTGGSHSARVLTGFALQPRAQAARRLGDALRDAASA
jgi:recA bacterial DNA recombination protein